MVVDPSPESVLFVAAVVALAGTINGIAGFGFAVVGTMLLATTVDPASAVVFMILPILAVNLSLASELSGPELRTCGSRFAPLLGAAAVGTVAGMGVLHVVPEAPLRVGLGVVTLGFVATVQRVVPLPALSHARDRCFVETPAGMVGVGGASGLLFGATNVGVQLVAYVRSCGLPHGLFVGVVALVFLGINGLRVVAAAVLGLYPDAALVAASLAAVIPAAAGVAVGKRLRDRVRERERRLLVLGLLTVIGVRLTLGGFGLL